MLSLLPYPYLLPLPATQLLVHAALLKLDFGIAKYWQSFWYDQLCIFQPVKHQKT